MAGSASLACAIVLSIVAGHDPHDPGSADVPARDYAAGIDAPIAGIVIGVPWRWLEEEAPCTPETRAGLNAALAVFRDLGATIRAVEPPPMQLFNDAKKIIAIAELYSIREKPLRRRRAFLVEFGRVFPEAVAGAVSVSRSPESLAGIVRLPRRAALTHEGHDRSAAPQSGSLATYCHKKPPEPGTRCSSTREGLPFYPLKPKARLARALVELDPRHALAP
jgi:Asp-tRNA(Asn)/Glu-tRNA(Gln) amidotransferase A subunit family amidase